MKRLMPVLLIMLSPMLAAEPDTDLRDPMTRDEDISRTRVHVEHVRLGNGLHEYIYTVEAPESNNGTVSNFSVDLSCSVAFTPMRLPELDDKPGHRGNQARPGTITPATIDAESDTAVAWGIRHSGEAYWNTRVLPGESRGSMRLISSAPPGYREYTLRPEWNTDSDEWDYPQQITDGMPWVTDFVVKGEVLGPGCPEGRKSEKKTSTRRKSNGAVMVSAPSETSVFANAAIF